MSWWTDLLNLYLQDHKNNPGPKPIKEPGSEPVDKQKAELVEYYFGTSDQAIPGHAIVMPAAHRTGNIVRVSVGDEEFMFHSVWASNQEIWYGQFPAEHYEGKEIVVETGQTIYSTEIEKPIPSPTNNGDKEKGYYHGQANGNRSHVYWKGYRSGPAKVYLDEQLKMEVRDMSQRQTGSNGLLWKPRSEWYGGPCFLGEYEKHYSSGYLIK